LAFKLSEATNLFDNLNLYTHTQCSHHFVSSEHQTKSHCCKILSQDQQPPNTIQAKHPRKTNMPKQDLQPSLLNAKTGLATSLHTLSPDPNALLTGFGWERKQQGKRPLITAIKKFCFKVEKNAMETLEMLELALGIPQP
jgi:hypothetical protein